MENIDNEYKTMLVVAAVIPVQTLFQWFISISQLNNISTGEHACSYGRIGSHREP